MRIISTEKMPVPKGHYSQVVEHGGVLYLSGQLPVDAIKGIVPETIEEQTMLVLQKIELLLTEAGSSKNKVLQMRIYLSDIQYWDQVNEVYSMFFTEHKPARCIIPSGKLHHGCMIEIEAVAFV
jgi:2-iminobutanoate/2-iminopropanoate deaminase